MIAKSYWVAGEPPSPPSAFHCGDVTAWVAFQMPSGAYCASSACLPPLSAPVLLNAGMKEMLLKYLPPLPWWMQWPAVQTRLLLPGCAGSATTVAEHW